MIKLWCVVELEVTGRASWSGVGWHPWACGRHDDREETIQWMHYFRNC